MVADRRGEGSRSHLASLPTIVEAVLSDLQIGLAEIDAIAVSAGPGSFTGLRVGAAFAKGLAYAGAIPLIGVSTLEAHASRVEERDGTLVCVANDARRGEVYAALFAARGGGMVERRWPDRAWDPARLRDALPSDVVLTGDAFHLVDAGREVGLPTAPSGGTVARLGSAALLRGERARVGDFEPTYVRAPDATLPSPRLR